MSWPRRILPAVALGASVLVAGAALHLSSSAEGGWTRIAPLPAPIARPVALTGSDGRIYVLDQQGGGALQIYDLRTGVWTTGPPVPTPRQEPLTTFGADGRLYVLGEIDRTLRTQPGKSMVQAFDPKTNAWTTLAPMETGHDVANDNVVADADGHLYVLGRRGFIRPHPFETETYDPQADRWAAGAGPYQKVFDAAGFTGFDVADGRHLYEVRELHTAGPSVVRGYEGVRVQDYDPQTGAATLSGSAPLSPSGFATAIGPDHRIYVIGGSLSARPLVADAGDAGQRLGIRRVQRYDPTARTWTSLAPLPDQLVGTDAAAATAGGRIHVISGSGPAASYDPEATGSSSPAPLVAAVAALVGAGALAATIRLPRPLAFATLTVAAAAVIGWALSFLAGDGPAVVEIVALVLIGVALRSRPVAWPILAAVFAFGGTLASAVVARLDDYDATQLTLADPSVVFAAGAVFGFVLLGAVLGRRVRLPADRA